MEQYENQKYTHSKSSSNDKEFESKYEENDLLKMKEFHYGNIHDCPMSQLLIATRMLDKVRRLVRLSYLEEVEKDLGHIPAVELMLKSSHEIKEDTLNDLKNYIHLYERGKNESNL